MLNAGDGVVTEEDMELIMRQAGGASLGDAEVRTLIERVMASAGARENGMTFPVFAAALQGAAIDLSVDVPLE